LGEGWALREETKKASRFDDKKVYLENKVEYWPFIKKESGRRCSTVGARISRIARFQREVSGGPSSATAFFLL